ncbi:bifunctional DNA primase/polymerase [Thermodesulfobacteriota bacterium]
MLDSALKYLSQGYSVIPCGKNKKSLIKWKPYQERLPTPEEVTEWWTEHPEAQLAIITGGISDLSVVDTDSEDATKTMTELIGFPTVKTPSGGCHWYFKAARVGNKARFLPDTDFRSTGGYVVAPPSKGLNGNDYLFVSSKPLSERPILPKNLSDLLLGKKTRDPIETPKRPQGDPTGGQETPKAPKDPKRPHKTPRDPKRPQSHNATEVDGKAMVLDSYEENNGFFREDGKIIDESSQKDESVKSVGKHNNNNEKSNVLPITIYSTSNSNVTGDFDVPEKHRSPTLKQGTRDHDIFRLALSLFRGGQGIENVTDYCISVGKDCDPVFTREEVVVKVESALRHHRETESGAVTTEAIREWVSQQYGIFTAFECYRDNGWDSPEQRKYVRKVLARMVETGEIDRTKKAGQFSPAPDPVGDIDITAPTRGAMNVRYPLDLHHLYATFSRSITCIVSSPNVGKTALALNFALANLQGDYPICYQSSEFGAEELVERLIKFGLPLKTWSPISFKEVPYGWERYIIPDGINIVDYLEPIEGDYSKIGVYIDLIHEKLTTGMCLICLQKKWGQDLGQGGVMTLKKPRLYVTINSNAPDGNIAKIVKLKNRAKGVNYAPDGRICRFKIVNGAEIQPLSIDGNGFARWEPPPQAR